MRNFKGFEVLSFSMSAATAQLLSSDGFYKLPNGTRPFKIASANVSFNTNNSEIQKFLVVTLWSQMSD